MKLVQDYYKDDKNSRPMTGMKDYVSLGKKRHAPKRLILCGLGELHAAFKKEYPEVVVGLSKFCELRPKECILIGPKGTHMVCVCTMHQNAKFMLSALGIKETLHDLVDLIVCDRTNADCMLHRCKNCPGIADLPVKIRRLVVAQCMDEDCTEDDINEYLNSDIKYSQWTTVDRADLETHILPLIDFIHKFCIKLDSLTAHSFTAKTQSTVYKERKSNLKENEAVVTLDFAENYKFIVQDEAQGYHWNNAQCTLHPVAIYVNQSGTVNEYSMCIMSDDLTHDVDMVHQVTITVVSYLKSLIPDIKLIRYFSDGCSGQYKNCKNFYNACMHEKEHGIKCTWEFFATSHGKNSCDGIGGAVKRTVRTASLQRTVTDQILNVTDMFQFCQSKMLSIYFVLIKKSFMDNVRQKKIDEGRYQLAKTIPGTRSYHCYIPIRDLIIDCKRTSTVTDVFSFDFGKRGKRAITVNEADIKPNCYVLCKYDCSYYIGIVRAYFKDNYECEVKFMTPKLSKTASYSWPTCDDICDVPSENIVSLIDIYTPTGRQYVLTAECKKKIFKKLKL